MTPQIPIAEFLIRGAAAGGFMLLALAIGHARRMPIRVTGALFCLGAASHTLTQVRPVFEALGYLKSPIWALSVMASGLFWGFAIELFGDNRRLAPTRFIPAAALLADGLAAVAAPEPVSRALWLLQNLIGAGLMIHVLVVVWTGWRADLVEARRRLRGPLLGAAAIYALVIVSVQSAELFARTPEQLSLVAAVSLLALSIAGGLVFLRAEPQLFGSPAGSSEGRPVDARDQALLARLRQALDADEIWREEGLTIGALASRLGAPEHHLRRLINEGLGYRNFIAFINERRIAAAKQALADPAKARTTIATVAYEVGFGSLGPFNRVFRQITGQTPTTWRKAAQADWPMPGAAA
ncbi:helix-turn-helix domain-containing protein [Phenylobacterium sp.]|uniref:helix-turn-helix domain-containing protein n=1 Tax=Phenylobacterium sp. TaxID=1871053 RepID=UPI003569E76E